MFNKKNNYRGAQFDYESDVCEAHGNFRFDESQFTSADIQGTIKNGEDALSFRANYDNQGVTNIYGVTDVQKLEMIGAEVAAIITHIQETNE